MGKFRLEEEEVALLGTDKISGCGIMFMVSIARSHEALIP